MARQLTVDSTTNDLDDETNDNNNNDDNKDGISGVVYQRITL